MVYPLVVNVGLKVPFTVAFCKIHSFETYFQTTVVFFVLAILKFAFNVIGKAVTKDK